MADGRKTQEVEGLNEKIKSLHDLITNLQEQTKELQARKISTHIKKSPKSQSQKLSTVTSQWPLHQHSFQDVEASHLKELIRDKEKCSMPVNNKSIVVSKGSGVKHPNVVSCCNNTETVIVDQYSQKAGTSKRAWSNEKAEFGERTGSSEEVRVTDQTNLDAGNSDNRLSRLAKEIWSKQNEKLRRGRYPLLNQRRRNQRYLGVEKQLLENNDASLRKSTYKVDNLKNHFVKRSLPAGQNSLLENDFANSQIDSDRSNDVNLHDMRQERRGKSSIYSRASIQNSEKQPEELAIVEDISESATGIGNNSDDFEVSSSLATSSHRLSSLAKETWKKSVLSRSSNVGYMKKWMKSDQVPSWNPALDEKHIAVGNKIVRGFVAKEHSKIDSPSGGISSDDRLSKLAKRIWQNRAKFRPIMSNISLTSSNRKRSLGYTLKSSRTQKIFHQPPSKFTWISNEKRVNSFLNRRRRAVLKQSRFKIVKGNANKKSIPNRSSIQKRTKKGKESKVLFSNTHGKKFVTDTKGRRLVRLSLSSSYSSRGPKLNEALQRSALLLPTRRRSILYHTPSKYKMIRRQSLTHSTSSKIVTATRMVKKSVFRLRRQNARKFVKEQYCMFYNRFGKCKNGDKCRYVHDPEKVAVCTRYLRGTCKDENCLFSHKIDTRKMPTCLFFLNGACHRENCPYAHVKVSGNAEICKEFLKGYCPSGDKCLKRHMLECEEFSKKGSCQEGDKCKMYHRRRNHKRRRSSSVSGTKVPRPFTKKVKLRRNSDEMLNIKDNAESDLKIKPSFTSVENPEWGAFGMTRLKRKRRFDWKREIEHE